MRPTMSLGGLETKGKVSVHTTMKLPSGAIATAGRNWSPVVETFAWNSDPERTGASAGTLPAALGRAARDAAGGASGLKAATSDTLASRPCGLVKTSRAPVWRSVIVSVYA